MNARRRRTVLSGMLLASGLALARAGELPLTTLQVGGASLRAEVATTADQQAAGLRGRTYLANEVGMLFPLSHDHAVCLWMAGTDVALSAAFIDARGRIVGLAELRPNDPTYRCAPVPVRYALEVSSGWFDVARVTLGDKVTGLPGADMER